MVQCHRDYVEFELFQVTEGNRENVCATIKRYEELGWVRLSSHTTGGIQFIRLGWPVYRGKPARPE